MVRVTWTAATYADTYNLYRSTTPLDASPTLLASGLTGTTYDDEVASGTTYYYKMKAVGESGTSTAFSNEDSGYAGGLAAPTGVDATDDDYDKVRVSWSAVTGATDYDVYRDGSPIATGVTALYYDDLPVAGGGGSYAVLANNGLESSGLSSADSGLRPHIPAPTGFTASTDADDGIHSSWTASDGATGYDVYLNGSIYEADVATTTHTIPAVAVTACQDYTLLVVARRDVSGLYTNYSAASNSDTGRVVLAGEMCAASPINRSASGAGLDETFNFCGGDWDIYFDAISFKDQLDVYLDGGLLWSSGCITGNTTVGFSTSLGAHTVRLVVTHNCDPLDPPGSSWSLTLSCS